MGMRYGVTINNYAGARSARAAGGGQRLAAGFFPSVLGNGDVGGRRLQLLWRRRFSLVEQPELVGIERLGTGAEALVDGEPQLLFEHRDAHVTGADQRLERADIVGQFRRCFYGVAHVADNN